MSFSHHNGGVAVIDGQVITATQFTNVFRDIERCYDSVGGSNGVVSAPSTAILIGGSGLTCSGQFTASGATATLSATAVSVTGAVTRSSSLTLSGAGATTFHRYLAKGSPGASTTISVANDVISFGNPTLPCTVDVTRPSGSPAGLTIWVYVIGQLANAYTFQDNAVTMFTFITGTPDKQSALLVWNGSAWEVGGITANSTLAAGY